jgi:hypothetical protein
MLIIFDCSHAGGSANLVNPNLKFAKSVQSGLVAPGLEITNLPLPPEMQKFLQERKGSAALTSSGLNEISFEGKPFSVFTVALIEGLCGNGSTKRDGYVRLLDLANYVRKIVSDRTNHRQDPSLYYNGYGDMEIAFYSGGDTNAKESQIRQLWIEPYPGAKQRGEIVYGPQTNIAGSVAGPVLSGTFSGKVVIGDKREKGKR